MIGHHHQAAIGREYFWHLGQKILQSTQLVVYLNAHCLKNLGKILVLASALGMARKHRFEVVYGVDGRIGAGSYHRRRRRAGVLYFAIHSKNFVQLLL